MPTTASVTLESAAFGAGGPDLPQPDNALDSWHRAVALGGRGYYARARAELRRTRLFPDATPTIASLTFSTEGSLLRQLGGHRPAAGYDGAALGCLDGGKPESVLARCDAMTGLAADALGQGRLAVSGRLLERCAAELCDSSLLRTRSWRQRLRFQWVSAELAMASGAPDRALQYAQTGALLAGECPSTRHAIKSDLLVAAARCVSGDLDAAREMGADVLKRCEERGLVPLQWAAAMLLDGIAPGTDAGTVALTCARVIERRGGRFRKPTIVPDGVGIRS
ncbi:hypothetical protein [Antrihabitans cavernicola]|uniref:Uncharacterized protein n=1 Tax=Antrihabitans cavernicola TaxID=2495913 RepID=A0A5A7SDC4_9NOCA|nr:hypothetical protein [Spelaeibacter cavernicola]KAA0022737.1 hypothetical protein FOY51_13760 [Spelaeibacter cavernicola]